MSPKAELDLDNIIEFTITFWGKQQADRYSTGIRDCCRLLAENPSIGRSCNWYARNLRRMEHGSHIIFYRETPEGLLISRILHKSMEPGRHVFESRRRQIKPRR